MNKYFRKTAVQGPRQAFDSLGFAQAYQKYAPAIGFGAGGGLTFLIAKMLKANNSDALALALGGGILGGIGTTADAHARVNTAANRLNAYSNYYNYLQTPTMLMPSQISLNMNVDRS